MSAAPESMTRRPAFTPPGGDWKIWNLYDGDRGTGKTWSAADFIARFILATPGSTVMIVGNDFAAARDLGARPLIERFEAYGAQPSLERMSGDLVLNGKRIGFLHELDNPTRARGSQPDIVWINGCRRVPEMSLSEWKMIAFLRGRMIISP